MGTAARAAAAASGGPVPVGLAANVSIDNRPVTNHGLKSLSIDLQAQLGLTGMSTKPLGPGRTIADKSFYSQGFTFLSL